MEGAEKANVNRVSITGLTNDQLAAYNTLIDFINKPYDVNDSKRALVGPAGTGKTYLVKSLISNCSLSHSQIGLAATTHKACRVMNEALGIPGLKVNTLQSDLGLRVNFDIDKFDINNIPFDPKGKCKIGEYNLYIIDESSMINRGLCTYLEKVAKKEATKILYIGDASQLAPVKESYSSAFRGIKMSSLTQIVRQGEDNPISPLLELLRSDIVNKRYDFLSYIIRNKEKFNAGNIKGYKVVNMDEFQQIAITNFGDEAITKNVDFVKIVGYTNNCVSGWNKWIRQNIIKDSDKDVITKNDLILSYTTLVDDFNDAIIKNSEEYILKDVVNYQHPKYDISGYMVRFIAIHGGKSTSPLFVVNHKDSYSLAKYIQISNDLISRAKTAPANVRGSAWREYFKFKNEVLLLTNINKKDNTILYGRDLDYGFALTAHKSQGSTFDTVLVDIDDIVFDKNGNPYTNCEEVNRRLYVACSRAKNKLYLKYSR